MDLNYGVATEMRAWGEVCRRNDWRGWEHHGGGMYERVGASWGVYVWVGDWMWGGGGGRECVLWKYVGIGKDGLLESCACVHEGSMCV